MLSRSQPSMSLQRPRGNMRSTQPPEIPRWLLERFGSSRNDSAVIGDLDERYRSGRSAVWYWKQAAVAVVASFFNEVWDHKWLTQGHNCGLGRCRHLAAS